MSFPITGPLFRLLNLFKNVLACSVGGYWQFQGRRKLWCCIDGAHFDMPCHSSRRWRMFVDAEMTRLAVTLRTIHRIIARRIQGTFLIV